MAISWKKFSLRLYFDLLYIYKYTHFKNLQTLDSLHRTKFSTCEKPKPAPHTNLVGSCVSRTNEPGHNTTKLESPLQFAIVLWVMFRFVTLFIRPRTKHFHFLTSQIPERWIYSYRVVVSSVRTQSTGSSFKPLTTGLLLPIIWVPLSAKYVVFYMWTYQEKV